MSSTTSSDCESCDCSQCTYSFENNHNDCGKLLMNSRHVPMYATVAHPLIYYAEVQQPLKEGQTYDQPRKENPFKKAFKWYTQERPLCNKNDVAPERSGFANWLDNKYVEYLRESGQQTKPPTSHEPRTPKTSIAESCAACPGTTKKYGRFKNPWRKRRRSRDVPKKCPNGSCQFLLKPKELMRAASETCYHTPTSGGKSNSTVTSSNMHCNTKCSGRSNSLSDVAREKSVLEHGDTVPYAVQECPNCQEQAAAKLAITSCACHQKQARTKLLKSMCVCPQEQVPSKEQDATQAEPCCNFPKEKVPEVVQVPTKAEAPTDQLKLLQEEVSKVPSKEQDPANQPKPLQENVPQIVKVLSKEQDPSNQLKPLQKKVLSKTQEPTNQLGLCCKCHLEKVPEVVQVPSQSRAVERSCQYPEEKVVPVHEETQYEPASEPARSTQNLGACYCKTCNKPTPPPSPMLCIPVKNNCDEENQLFGPISIQRQSYSTVAINEEAGEYSIVKEVAVVNKFTRSVTCASNEAVQTSDHSIRFEKDACSAQYPLFFKIIYPDISKNE